VYDLKCLLLLIFHKQENYITNYYTLCGVISVKVTPSLDTESLTKGSIIPDVVAVFAAATMASTGLLVCFIPHSPLASFLPKYFTWKIEKI
jgi:hypothetical protein